MELAIGTIVMLILTILLFVLSIYWVTSWFGEAKELQTNIDKQTESQILERMLSGNELVLIPFNRQNAKRGESAQFEHLEIPVSPHPLLVFLFVKEVYE